MIAEWLWDLHLSQFLAEVTFDQKEIWNCHRAERHDIGKDVDTKIASKGGWTEGPKDLTTQHFHMLEIRTHLPFPA